MSRLAAVAVASLVGGLPSGTHILTSEYREECIGFLVPSPPCVAVRFQLRGPVDDRVNALVRRAGRRWNVTRVGSRDGWDLRYRRGELRARADVLTEDFRRTCRSPLIAPVSCTDWLQVELRPLPKLQLEPHVTPVHVDTGFV